jgi:hypothetical protein
MEDKATLEAPYIVSTNIKEENIPLAKLKHVLVDQGFQFILDSPAQR